METDNPNLQERTPQVSPGNYSPVTVNVNDSIGAFLVGILAIILLIGWMRAEAHLRALPVKTGDGV